MCYGGAGAPSDPDSLRVGMRRGARTPLLCILLIVPLSSALHISPVLDVLCTSLWPEGSTERRKPPAISPHHYDAVRSRGLFCVACRRQYAYMKGQRQHTLPVEVLNDEKRTCTESPAPPFSWRHPRNAEKAPRSHHINDAVISRGLIALYATHRMCITCACYR